MNKKDIKNEITKLNDLAMNKVLHYLNLNVSNNLTIGCPYYIDTILGFMIDLMRKSNISEENIDSFYQRYKNKETDFGWFSGKGSPEEIESAIKYFLNESFKNKPITKQGIVQLMRLRGIGIDCSGLVYQLLLAAFNSIDRAKEFNESLDWVDINKKNVRRANVNVFVGNASFVIEPKDIRPLDLVVQRRHIAIVLKKGDQFIIAQSTPWSLGIDGVNLSNFGVTENKPFFEFRPIMGDVWEDSYKKGELKFRRLNILK